MHIYRPVWNIGDTTEAYIWIGASFMGTSIGHVLDYSLRSLYLTQVCQPRYHVVNLDAMLVPGVRARCDLLCLL